MTDAIKPCPFCGGTAHVWEDSSSDYRSHWDWFVVCDDRDNCWADGGRHDTREQAVGFWNNRPIEDALSARVAQLEQELMVGKILGTISIQREARKT